VRLFQHWQTVAVTSPGARDKKHTTEEYMKIGSNRREGRFTSDVDNILLSYMSSPIPVVIAQSSTSSIRNKRFLLAFNRLSIETPT